MRDLCGTERSWRVRHSEREKATCHPGFEEKLTGASVSYDNVVTDGNVITSRGMGTCIEFAGAIIAALKDDETAKQVKDAIVYQG